MNQMEKAVAFRAMHYGDGAFVIPNPWDRGTARLLAQMGFAALATTSAGYAFSRGQRDGSATRDEMLAHVGEIVGATELPVSADLENGYGSTLEEVAETFRLAAAAGLAGASIEDATGDEARPVFDRVEARERVAAAVEAVKRAGVPFVVTGRAENYLWGRPDLSDTIARLQAYQEAGAEVLYAPGVKKKEEIAAIVRSVDRPVNIVAGLGGMTLSVAELAGLGVKRISLGSVLCRAAFGALLRAAAEVRERGTFTFAEEAVSYGELNRRW